MATEQIINGIVIDFNRMTRLEFRDFMQRLLAAESPVDQDTISGEIVEKVVVSWPYSSEITTEAYLNLPLLDSKMVDDAITEVMGSIGKKK